MDKKLKVVKDTDLPDQVYEDFTVIKTCFSQLMFVMIKEKTPPFLLINGAMGALFDVIMTLEEQYHQLAIDAVIEFLQKNFEEQKKLKEKSE